MGVREQAGGGQDVAGLGADSAGVGFEGEVVGDAVVVAFDFQVQGQGVDGVAEVDLGLAAGRGQPGQGGTGGGRCGWRRCWP